MVDIKVKEDKKKLYNFKIYYLNFLFTLWFNFHEILTFWEQFQFLIYVNAGDSKNLCLNIDALYHILCYLIVPLIIFNGI